MSHLEITRRRVAADRQAAYDAAWKRLRGCVVEAGARVWRFRSRADPVEHTEFLEWSGSDPRGEAAVATAIAALGTIASAISSDWTAVEDE